LTINPHDSADYALCPLLDFYYPVGNKNVEARGSFSYLSKFCCGVASAVIFREKLNFFGDI